MNTQAEMSRPMASQECVAVLQRMLDDVRGIGRVCATNVIYAAGEQDQALTAAIDALQRQGEVVAWRKVDAACRPIADWRVDPVPMVVREDVELRHWYHLQYAYALPPQPPTGEQTP